MAEQTFVLPERFRRSDDFVTAMIDGDLVALSISRGSYFGLSGIGTRLWELLDTPRSIDELIAQICAEFDVDAVTAGADIQSFVSDLHENRLLEPAA